MGEKLKGYRKALHDLRSKVLARIPLIGFRTQDPQSVYRMISRLQQSNQFPQVTHVFSKESSLLALDQNGQWEGANEVVDALGKKKKKGAGMRIGMGGRRGGGSKFLSAEKIQPNSIIIYPNLYRIWNLDQPRLKLDDAEEFYEYYKVCEQKHAVSIIRLPTDKLPSDDENLFHKIEYGLPDEYERKLLLQDFVQDVYNQERFPEFIKKLKNHREDLKQILHESSAGMTGEQFQASMREMAIEGIFDPDYIRGKKIEYIETSGADTVVFHKELPDPKTIGGMTLLKDWVDKNKKFFLDPDSDINPSGIMMLGPPGTGKSLGTKYIAGTWGLPLVEVVTDKLLSKWMGESEQNMRKALDIAEAVAPCILFFDEVEKMLGGGGGGDDDDGGGGGDMAQILGMLLGWLNDKNERGLPIFVVMTCNEHESLRPELKRRGRLDAMFGVLLPPLEEKLDILRVGLEVMDLNPEEIIPYGDKNEMRRFDDATNRFAGAELFMVGQDALAEADEDRDAVTWETIITVTERETPIAVKEWSAVESVIGFCQKHCKPANKQN